MIMAYLNEDGISGPPVREAMPLVQRMQSAGTPVSPVDADKCR